MAKLTVNKVKGITKPGKYGDGRNLWLIVGSSGRKRWEFRYTLNGQSREMGLGSVDFMSPDDARDRAHDLRKMVKQGIDPIEAKAREIKRPATTFREVAEDCISAQAEGWTNTKSEGQWRQSLTTYA